MILESIIQQLSSKIYALGFVSKSGGLGRELIVSAAGTTRRIVSAAIAPFSDNRYFELSPDRKDSGIVFFTAGATRVIRQDVYTMTLENEIVLYGWINGEITKADQTTDPELLIVAQIRKARFKPEEGHPVRGIEIDYVGSQEPDFSRFGWDDAVFQYGAHPHKLFRHQFRVNYVVSVGCSTQSVTVAGAVC